MREAVCLAPAKINLALHVTGRRSDGYHELDTLVAFAAVADRVRVRASRQPRFRSTGPFAAALGPDEGNLAGRAEAALRSALGAGLPAVEILLEKNLPVASGVGGGSADAAATLLALSAVWLPSASTALDAVAERLGSDVPMCLRSQPLRARGRGERIELLGEGPDIPAVLVNPGVAVPTPAIFAALESRENPPIDLRGATLPDIRQLAAMRNDLEAPALRLFPVIGDALAALRASPGCRFARMSGSGATCFALFASAQSASVAARTIRAGRPHWWCEATALLGGPMPGRLATLDRRAA